MIPEESLYRFPAQMESLGAVLAHIEHAAADAGSDAILRAQTAVEELFTNSVMYGRTAEDPDPWVWLGVAMNNGQLRIRFEDPFKPFDPFNQLATAAAQSQLPMEQRPVGGLGVLMAYRLADHARYTHERKRNCVDLRFNASSSG